MCLVWNYEVNYDNYIFIFYCFLGELSELVFVNEN